MVNSVENPSLGCGIGGKRRMQVTISVQTIITAAALIAAVAALIGYYNKAYRWYQKQEKQDQDIASMKMEQSLLTYGVLACLKGLHEQGANGPVTEAIAKLEKHINQKAHDQI